jgi:hypothetical protein
VTAREMATDRAIATVWSWTERLVETSKANSTCQGDTSHDRCKSAMFLMISMPPLPELRLMTGGLAGHGTLV